MLETQKEESVRRLYPTSWKESAAICGMIYFFEFCRNRFISNPKYKLVDNEYLEYNVSDIQGDEAEHNYLAYVEYTFKDRMHHKQIEEKLLSTKELTDDDIKMVNDRMSGNSICKKVFKDIKKYSPEKHQLILDTINKNRDLLIKETYRNTVYKSINNDKSLFKEPGDVARLNNYYMDLPKKKKSMAYNWNYDTYECTDMIEYDFIPFAFTDTPIKFFINCNSKLTELKKFNENLKKRFDEVKKELFRYNYFQGLMDVSDMMDNNVEIIILGSSGRNYNDYFETVYLRKDAIMLFRNLKENMNDSLSVLKAPCKLSNGEYINVADIVANYIVNYIFLDNLIMILLMEKDKKNSKKNGFLIDK